VDLEHDRRAQAEGGCLLFVGDRNFFISMMLSNYLGLAWGDFCNFEPIYHDNSSLNSTDKFESSL